VALVDIPEKLVKGHWVKKGGGEKLEARQAAPLDLHIRTASDPSYRVYITGISMG
jgi:hypothetical protein